MYFFCYLCCTMSIPERIRLCYDLGEMTSSQRLANNHQTQHVLKWKSSSILQAKREKKEEEGIRSDAKLKMRKM